MLYYAATTLKTDGAVMVTGSHNPPDYNGFKMVLGRQAVLRRADPASSARMAAPATWWPEADAAASAASTSPTITSPACCADWDGGDRLLKVVWDNGNGAAGEVLQQLVAALPGEHVVLNGAIDGTLPGASSRPDGAGKPAATDRGGGRAQRPISASPSTATPTASAWSTTRADHVRRPADGGAGARRAAGSIRARRSSPT